MFFWEATYFRFYISVYDPYQISIFECFQVNAVFHVFQYPAPFVDKALFHGMDLTEAEDIKTRWQE